MFSNKKESFVKKIEFQIKGYRNSSSFEDGNLQINKNLITSHALQILAVKALII